MKKLLFATLLIIGSVGYVFTVRSSATAETGVAAIGASNAQKEAIPTVSGTAPRGSMPPPTTKNGAATKTHSGTYVDGTYVGTVADAYYGNIQVEAIVSGERLTAVKVLQYPNDRRDSIEINTRALPRLVSEAVSAQSAQVNAVSGASDTSAAFTESLSAALKKAA